MRRNLASLLSVDSLQPVSGGARRRAADAGGPPTAPAGEPAADPLADLLEERALKQTRNPVVASFLAGEGRSWCRGAPRARLQQLRGRSEPDGLHGPDARRGRRMMGSETMKKQQDWAQKQSPGKPAGRAYLGIGPAPADALGDQMQREMQEALTDHWVRGIEAAGALERLGDPNAAARSMSAASPSCPGLGARGVSAGILGLGPERPSACSPGCSPRAESITEAPMAAPAESEAWRCRVSIPTRPARSEEGDPQPGTVQVRNAALAGLGFLLAGAACRPIGARLPSSAPRLQRGEGERAVFRGAARRARALPRCARRSSPAAACQMAADPNTKQTALRALA